MTRRARNASARPREGAAPSGGEGERSRGNGSSRPSAAAFGAAALVVLVTLATFGPVLDHGFLNWDDPDALVHNVVLDGPEVGAWAWRTTHLSHYQPLSWLAWAGGRRALGTEARAHHLMSLGLHATNAVLVLLLAARLLERSGFVGALGLGLSAWAALLFALHPLRVEPVAWASALPYLLALALLLLAVLAYLRHLQDARSRRWWLGLALVFYGASLLARPIGLGLPVVLLLLDVFAGRFTGPARDVRRPLLEKLLLAVLAVAAAVVEAAARPLVSLDRIGPGARLSEAVVAPFRYLARTLFPTGLTPLDPLPLDPRTSWPALVGGSVALLAVTLGTLWLGRRRVEPALLWLTWLVLLLPATGLAPSGVQATADRYTYVAGMVPAVALAAGLGWITRRVPHAARGVGFVLALVVVALLGFASRRELGFWRDSVSLWSRAVALDPRNDVALYNLASALAEAGDETAAARRYRELLELLPDHGPARRNLALLEAKDLEQRAGAAATSGRLSEAIGLYSEALVRDPARLHSRASRGFALARLERCPEAVPDLHAAVEGGRDEPPLLAALVFCLAATDRVDEARATLQRGLARHPGDPVLEQTRDRLAALRVRR